MANSRGKKIDNTHLSINTAEERRLLHRDYIAHCLRWSHVARHLHHGQLYKRAHILDVGCGREVPLARLLYSNRLIPVTGSYTGVDYNKLEMPEMLAKAKFPIKLQGQCQFPRQFEKVGDKHKHFIGYDVITCFEVAEHIEPADTLLLLEGITGHLNKDGIAFLSTPCYDPQTGAADNHVNEMSYWAFGAMIRHAGLHINDVFGTFASIKDYKEELSRNNSPYGDLAEAFNRLRQYYDTNYLATIFAPLFPEQSRNCLWEVSLVKTDTDVIHHPPLQNHAGPEHSSSAEWPAFIQGLKKPVTKKGRK